MLVAEDDLALRRLIAAVLTAEGLAVTEVGSARELIEARLARLHVELLAKPFRLEQLRALVARALAAASSTGSCPT